MNASSTGFAFFSDISVNPFSFSTSDTFSNSSIFSVSGTSTYIFFIILLFNVKIFLNTANSSVGYDSSRKTYPTEAISSAPIISILYVSAALFIPFFIMYGLSFPLRNIVSIFIRATPVSVFFR